MTQLWHRDVEATRAMVVFTVVVSLLTAFIACAAGVWSTAG
jgi:hypothetical protein